VKPFLKWVGGKYKYLSFILPRLPKTKNRLVEPFVGAGAVFINVDYEEYLLCDLNQDLINFYINLQERKNGFIYECWKFFDKKYNNKETYNELRTEFNSNRDPAFFLYLNRHCFNGLCRYNKKNQFNVPFGKYKNPYFPRKEMEYFINFKADKCIFKCQDFEETFKEVKETDVCYIDPPYISVSKTANFTSYTSSGFDLTKQKKLAELSKNSKASVFASNADVPLIYELYKGCEILTYSANRNISCKNRGKIKEVLIIC